MIRDPSGDNATLGPAVKSDIGAFGGRTSVNRATGRAGGSGRGRTETHSARLVAIAATANGATSRTARRPGRPGAAAAESGAVVADTPLQPGRAKASTNCAAVWNRSAGSLARAFRTAVSTCGGTDSRSCRSGRGRSVTTLAITDCTVGPVCGGSPASISYRTAPRE